MAVVAKKNSDRQASSLTEEKRLVHLLKRALLGGSLTEYSELKGNSIAAVTQSLLNAQQPVSWPVKDYLIIDKKDHDRISYGETWIDDYSYNHTLNQLRKQSVNRWLAGSLYAQKKSVQPKMVLFWHNFFPLQTNRITLANTVFDYFFTLRYFALDDFRLLLLCLVSGEALPESYRKIKNSSGSVYTFYAERICYHLYGEQFKAYVSKNKLLKYARLLYEWSAINEHFSLSRHILKSQMGTKALTDFDGIQKPAIRQCLKALFEFHDKLINHEKVAGFVAEKLFRFFVNADVDALAEKRIIRRLTATAMMGCNIRDMLQTLFLNEEFYNNRNFGTLVKSPIDFLFGTCKLNKPDVINFADVSHYPLWDWIFQRAALLGQPVGNIADEKGWIGYYKTPQQEWLTAPQYFERRKVITEVSDPSFFEDVWQKDFDIVAVLNKIANIHQLDVLIEALVAYFCSTSYTKEKVQVVEAWLISQFGMNRQKWNRLVLALTDNPANAEARTLVTAIIKSLIIFFQNETEYNFI